LTNKKYTTKIKNKKKTIQNNLLQEYEYHKRMF